VRNVRFGSFAIDKIQKDWAMREMDWHEASPGLWRKALVMAKQPSVVES
jgi:hypothetical protein